MTELGACEGLAAGRGADTAPAPRAVTPADGPASPLQAPAGAGEDAAWVMVPTALPPEAVLRLLDDPERLLRVNPRWIFETWQRDTAGGFRLRVRDTLGGRTWSTGGQLEHCVDGLRLCYSEGLKASTRFRVEADGTGSRLWVIDDYSGLPVSEREARIDEVDRSLPAWGEALGRYLAAWHRWGRWRSWRWYIERVWRRMTPQARRIVRLLIWVSVFELAVFLLLVGVLALEQAR